LLRISGVSFLFSGGTDRVITEDIHNLPSKGQYDNRTASGTPITTQERINEVRRDYHRVRTGRATSREGFGEQWSAGGCDRRGTSGRDMPELRMPAHQVPADQCDRGSYRETGRRVRRPNR